MAKRLKTKSKGRENSYQGKITFGEKDYAYKGKITEYECPRSCGGFVVEAAVASYRLKGEDKFTVVTSATQPRLVDCQPKDESTILVSFAGIFDGHDGATAAEYCENGLLHHVIAETIDYDDHKTDNEENFDGAIEIDDDRSMMTRSLVSAYERAHLRFCASSYPPSYSEVKQGVDKVRATTSTTFAQKLFCQQQKITHGGTCACTLSLFARRDGENTIPVLDAAIANTGDSRCITDDGSGTAQFRKITDDHRLNNIDEINRLKPYIDSGENYLEQDKEPGGPMRLYPRENARGGLMVSRTIGDVSFALGAIPTPEVFFVPLEFSERKKKYRFLIASDGLFDVLDTEAVGKVAALKNPEGCWAGDSVERDTKETAKSVLGSCLNAGGFTDDVTVMVVDVSLSTEEAK